jgi:acyl carrier protein
MKEYPSMKEKITEVIYQCVDEINEGLKKKIEKKPESILFGKEGNLDSLGLVNLIVSIEEKINDTFGKTITLADERAMSQKHSPFKTIGTLSEYIGKLLSE